MNPLILLCVVIALGAFLTGLSKGGLGGALGTLVTPLLALAMPAPVAVGMSLPLLIIGDVFAVSAHWGGWDRRLVWALLPGSILGVVVGSLIIGSLSPLVVQHGLGAVAILYTLYKLWTRRQAATKPRPEDDPRWQASAFGSMTGLASTMANAGGPIMTIYLLTKQLAPSVFVATTALYFAILNALKVPGYLSAHILRPEMFVLVAWSIPLIPFGVWSGKLLDKRIDMATFEVIIVVLLAITGVALLLKT